MPPAVRFIFIIQTTGIIIPSRQNLYWSYLGITQWSITGQPQKKAILISMVQGLIFPVGTQVCSISYNNIIWGNKLVGRTNHQQIYLNYDDDIKFNDDYNDVQYLTQHNQYSKFGDYHCIL